MEDLGRPSPSSSHDSVKVLIRVRPFTEEEVRESSGTLQPTLVPHSDTVVTCVNPAHPSQRFAFPFDLVAWSIPEEQFPCETVRHSGQEDMYREVGTPTVDSAFEGYNGCVFAYGQTSSGKTYTMMGWDGEEGLVPRLARDLFGRIAQRSAAPAPAKKVECQVTISFMEIYMEQVHDLTVPNKGSGEHKSLTVWHDPKLGPVVKDLKHIPVTSWAGVERVLEVGNRQKTVKATAMNERSSRSHVVIQLTLNQMEVVGRVGTKDIVKSRRSRLNLVDLAGSEKILKSKVEGQGKSEAININQSLTALGRVIDALIQNHKVHIPYRDSILTNLLSDSLGGNSRTYMIATLSPASRNYEETLSTLRYAVRTRSVVNFVKVNEDAASALIRDLQRELEGLRAGRLPQARTAGEVEELQTQLQKTEDIIKELQGREQQEREEIAVRELQWGVQREALQQRHQVQLVELEQLTKDLEQKEAVLLVRKDALQVQMAALQKGAALNKFRLAARAALHQHRARCVVQESLLLQRAVRHATQQALSTQDQLKTHISTTPAAPSCDLCLTGSALYECNECAERYCAACDAKVHRKTNTHTRVACTVGRQPLKHPCVMCLVAEGAFFCRGCGNIYLCVVCDDLKHRNPKRAGHQRGPCAAPRAPNRSAPVQPPRPIPPSESLVTKAHFPRLPSGESLAKVSSLHCPTEDTPSPSEHSPPSEAASLSGSERVGKVPSPDSSSSPERRKVVGISALHSAAPSMGMSPAPPTRPQGRTVPHGMTPHSRPCLQPQPPAAAAPPDLSRGGSLGPEFPQAAPRRPRA